MLAWLSTAACRASRIRRRRAAGSASEGLRVLMATVRPGAIDLPHAAGRQEPAHLIDAKPRSRLEPRAGTIRWRSHAEQARRGRFAEAGGRLFTREEGQDLIP